MVRNVTGVEEADLVRGPVPQSYAPCLNPTSELKEWGGRALASVNPNMALASGLLEQRG